MDIKLNNGDKILIRNLVYVVAAVVMRTLYIKASPDHDYDYTEDEVLEHYKIEFLKEI